MFIKKYNLESVQSNNNLEINFQDIASGLSQYQEFCYTMDIKVMSVAESGASGISSKKLKISSVNASARTVETVSETSGGNVDFTVSATPDSITLQMTLSEQISTNVRIDVKSLFYKG